MQSRLPALSTALIWLLLAVPALLMIWRLRPYKFVVVRPELLSDEDRRDVLRRLHKVPHQEEP